MFDCKRKTQKKLSKILISPEIQLLLFLLQHSTFLPSTPFLSKRAILKLNSVGGNLLTNFIIYC